MVDTQSTIVMVASMATQTQVGSSPSKPIVDRVNDDSMECELDEMEGDREIDICKTDRELESVVKSSEVGVSISGNEV
jgi:hypothetical protein